MARKNPRELAAEPLRSAGDKNDFLTDIEQAGHDQLREAMRLLIQTIVAIANPRPAGISGDRSRDELDSCKTAPEMHLTGRAGLLSGRPGLATLAESELKNHPT